MFGKMGGNWSLTHYWERKRMQLRPCKTVWQFLKKLNRELPLDLIHSTARCVFKRSENICSRKNLHMDVPTTLLLTAKTQKHRKCRSVEAQTECGQCIRWETHDGVVLGHAKE